MDAENSTKDGNRGYRRHLHGAVYQYKILMLFVLHARKKNYDFNLFTELPDAEKFDDVVFQYEQKPLRGWRDGGPDKKRFSPAPLQKRSSEWTWRFVQVKSIKDTIKMRDLMSTSTNPSQNRFSLVKYFISFYKMKNNSQFKNDTLKDFTIITNTDIDLSEKPSYPHTRQKKDAQKWQSFFDDKDKNIKDDDILYFQNEKFKAKRVKLNECARNDLKEIFKPQFLETVELESKEMKYVKEIKNSLRNKKTKQYKVKIKKDFGNAIEKLENIGIEYNISDKDVLNMSNQISSKIKCALQYRKLPPNDRKQQIKDVDNSIDDLIEMIKSMVKKSGERIFNEYFNDFMNKFRFVICYPNEEELGELLRQELDDEFKLLNGNIVADAFEKEILYFLKGKANKGQNINKMKRNRIVYTQETAEIFFKTTQDKLNTLRCTHLSDAYIEKLRAYKIEFELCKEILYLDNILDEYQILCISTDVTRLSAIRLQKSLDDLKQSFVFIPLEILLLPETGEYMLNAFSVQENYAPQIFVIECQRVDAHKLNELCEKLLKILRNDPSKKLIVITESNDFMDNVNDINICREKDINISFEHLTLDSQYYLLKMEVQLHKDDTTLDRIFHIITINSSDLLRLIEGEKVSFSVA